MTNAISQIGSSPALEQLKPKDASGAPGEFQNLLQKTIGSLESFGQDAAGAVEKFVKGENEELHTMVLATQRAELSFDLGLQVRNKVVQAYQEIMRMQM